MMAASRGAGVDWESIARGLVDNTVEFTLPAELEITASINSWLVGHEKMRGHATIKNGVTSVGYQSFAYCKMLDGVSIPNSVTSIGQAAFSQCYALEEVTLPSSIRSLAAQAFMQCTGLKRVISEASTPPTIQQNSFLNCNALAAIYVPDASVDAYKAASGWSNYADRIKPLSELVE